MLYSSKLSHLVLQINMKLFIYIHISKNVVIKYIIHVIAFDIHTLLSSL